MTNPAEMTVLTSVSRVYATKRIRRDRKTGKVIKTPYGLEKHFGVTPVSLSGFERLSRCLDRLTQRPFAFVIRGEPLPGIDMTKARRLVHADPETGECATFEEAPRRWFAVDMDRIKCPPLTSPVDDPDDAIEHLIGLLPPELGDASCWWQFTCSQSLPGTEDRLSARLWFWLAEPLDGASLTRWALSANKGCEGTLIDPSIYRAVQPHYVAAPIFEDGMRDPLPRRHGIRKGLDEAVSLVIPKASADDPYVGSTGYVGISIEGHLAQIGGDRGFRAPMVSAIAAYFSANGANAEPEAITRRVREAIAAAPLGGRTDADIARYRSDRHLNNIIGWVRARERANPAPRQSFSDMLDGLAAKVPIGAERQRAVRMLAEHLLRRLYSPKLAAALTADWNAVHCAPPLLPDQIEMIVTEAARKQIRVLGARHAA
jgi:hypothetical protein